MSAARKTTRNPVETKGRLVAATVGLMLKQGFAATSVDQICEDAGLTKGSFFHHFENKEAIGKAAVEWWGQMGTALYEEAWNDSKLEPLEQLHRMIDIMAGFTKRPGEACVCMVGMMSQELAATNPVMQEVCAKELQCWTDNVTRILSSAKKKHKPATEFDPKAVAWFLNSLWQGSMLVGKTCQSQAMIRTNLKLARSYVDGLFNKA